MNLWQRRLQAAQVIFIVGVIVTVASGASLFTSIKELFWGTTLAKVSALKVQTGPAYSLTGHPGTGMNVVIEYTYSVGSEHYFGGGGYPVYPRISKNSGEEFIRIRYNPAHPEQSVVPSSVSVPGAVFLGVGIASLVGTTVYSRTKKRREHSQS